MWIGIQVASPDSLRQMSRSLERGLSFGVVPRCCCPWQLIHRHVGVDVHWIVHSERGVGVPAWKHYS